MAEKKKAKATEAKEQPKKEAPAKVDTTPVTTVKKCVFKQNVMHNGRTFKKGEEYQLDTTLADALQNFIQ